MSTPAAAAPIIIAGTTGSGRRYVHYWGETVVAGIRGPQCLVEMADAGIHALTISQLCPPEWHPEVWAVFEDFCRGVMPQPTHTVTWSFGKPTFEVIL